MSVRPEVFQAILLLGLASLACRFGGFFLMRYVSITPRVDAWLRAIPIALIGAILGLGYQIANPGGPAAMHEGAGAVMPYVIILIAAFQLWYSWSQEKKGVLR